MVNVPWPAFELSPKLTEPPPFPGVTVPPLQVKIPLAAVELLAKVVAEGYPFTVSVRYYASAERAQSEIPKLQADIKKESNNQGGIPVEREGRFLYYWELSKRVPTSIRTTALKCLRRGQGEST